ncbi:hypothetical protein OG394_20815 [Kribbella sp. NBC_01245]|uniref:hypothetical protein n=1 Tax=Kribbella sp. NBC_01245 TaxID=2903578 RepID=UPI002E2BBCAE|nr:hypothetical protein [Kribbella sp. NBC_01245]
MGRTTVRGITRWSMLPTDAARLALVGLGLAAGLYGAWLLLHHLEPPALIRLPLWLGGAVFVDDFVIAPVVIVVGWLLTRRLGGSDALAYVRTALLYIGLTSLIALPLLLRQGMGANPTVLARNYLRDWLLLEATIVLVTLAVFAVRRRARRPSD